MRQKETHLEWVCRNLKRQHSFTATVLGVCVVKDRRAILKFDLCEPDNGGLMFMVRVSPGVQVVTNGEQWFIVDDGNFLRASNSVGNNIRGVVKRLLHEYIDGKANMAEFTGRKLVFSRDPGPSSQLPQASGV